ncbi:MAG: hypothetical protein N3A62_05605 [Thermodesulfovibrionales bacterium]|nr:hypothetical protein [Thermodesulfovibrionales bacterium]
MTKTKIIFLLAITLIFCNTSFAIDINAKKVVHYHKDAKFELEGDVSIRSEDAVIRCQKATLYEKSNDVLAEGNVFYEDKDTIMNAEKIALNLKSKTGEVFRAVIFFKNGNYWVSSERITKISEDRYYSNSARFTTCNPSYPDKKGITFDLAERESFDWCFKTGVVDITLGNTLDAKDVTYRIKDVPISYFPKLLLPIQKERKSGLLMPTIGNSSTKGFRLTPSLFWAIDEDKDMTLGFDYYSKRGLGTSLQYRYINPQGKGDFNLYYIHDKVMDDTQFQVVAKQDFSAEGFKQFADINYAKSRDMFKEYSFGNLDRTQRFLQSSFEISKDLKSSRIFLLNQYWIDLKYADNTIPQLLPSLGYFLNPTNIGPFSINMEATLSNLYRKEGTKAQRFDIMPVVSNSFGDAVKVFQKIAFRETLYNFSNKDDNSSQQHRETFQYYGKVLSSFVKRYDDMIHIVEPAVEYSFIPNRSDMIIFDSVEAFNKMSEFNLSLSNIFRFKESIIFAKINQPYVLLESDVYEHLRPIVFQGAFLSKSFSLRLDTSYDFKKNLFETFYTDMTINVNNITTVSIGERYNRDNKIMQFRTALNTKLTQKLSVGADVWYDTKGGGLRDSTLRMRIDEQCWAALVTVQRKPRINETADYSFYFLVELAGIGTIGKK